MSDEEARNNPIYVEWLGESGPRILVIHGGVQGGVGGGPETFTAQRSLAQEGFRLGFVDRPGFGKTASRGVDDMIRDVSWIGDLLEPGTHLLGHSWGGAEALLAAAAKPELVRSLTLIEPALQGLLVGDPAQLTSEEKRTLSNTMKPLFQAGTPGEYALSFMRGLGTEAQQLSR